VLRPGYYSSKNRDIIRPYGSTGICEFCHKFHMTTFGSGRFCKRSCQQAYLKAVRNTPEWKAKVSAKNTGRPSPTAGTHIPEERKAKISATHKRIKQKGSPVQIKMKQSMRKKWQDPVYREQRLAIYRSPEFRAKMSCRQRQLGKETKGDTSSMSDNTETLTPEQIAWFEKLKKLQQEVVEAQKRFGVDVVKAIEENGI
jgi:hypothetical protein